MNFMICTSFWKKTKTDIFTMSSLSIHEWTPKSLNLLRPSVTPLISVFTAFSTQGLCMWVSLFRFKTKYFIPIKQLNKNIKRDWISKSAFQGCVVCVQKHVVFCSVTLLNSLCLILIILNMLQIFMAQDMVYLGISSVGTWKECIFCCFGVECSICIC